VDHSSGAADAASFLMGASVGMTTVLEQTSLAYFGVPLAAMTAAVSGALLPTLLLDREPLAEAIKRWAGGVLFALLFTAAMLKFFGMDKGYAVAVAGALAAFARDLMALARGELPPVVTWFREKWTGKPAVGNGNGKGTEQ
jgi:hypothetical protein